MSNFTPLVSKTYEFEGDTVRVEFKRLKRKHMLNAIPALKRLQESDGDEAQLEKVNEFVNEIIDVIPEYIEVFDGLLDNQGQPITIETVIDDFYFLKLASQISMDMVKESSPQAQGNL